MEFIMHLNQDRKKRHAMSHTCANLFLPRPELCIKVESISAFTDTTKVANFREKVVMSAELKGCVA